MTSSNSSTASSNLIAHLKKMLPVWIIFFILVVGSLFMIRRNAVSYLESGIYASENAGEIAEVHYFAGMNVWRDIAADSTGTDNEIKLQGTLGEFEDDPRIAEAEQHFERALRTFEFQRGSHQKLAQLAFWKGDEADALFHLGNEYLLNSQLPLAKATIEGGIQFADADKKQEMLVALGQIMSEENDLDSLESLLQENPEIVDQNPTTKTLAAQVAYKNRQFERAEQLVREALEEDPANFKASVVFMNIHGSNPEEKDSMLWLLENLKSSDSTSAQLFHRLSLHFGGMQAYDPAYEAIDEAVRLSPNNIVLIMDKALIAHELGRENESKRLLDRALSINHTGFTDLIKEDRFQPIAQ